MSSFMTRKPRIDLHPRLQQPRNFDIIAIVVATAFVFAMSAFALIWEFAQ